jgi:hypothetical protein
MNIGLYLHYTALQINKELKNNIKVDGVVNNSVGSVKSWCTIKKFTGLLHLFRLVG